MQCAIGVSVHTGWAACVVASGSLAQPVILAHVEIELLPDAERFCFHRAAELERGAAQQWIARLRDKALANARRAFAPLMARGVCACAIIAKPGSIATLDDALSSHTRIHTAEGYFYRDVLVEACPVSPQLVAANSLDPSRVGKLAAPPWGKDQKLAALAAWQVLAR